MELSDYLRDPVYAALIAGGITAGYIHLKANLNNEGKLELNKLHKASVIECDFSILYSLWWNRTERVYFYRSFLNLKIKPID